MSRQEAKEARISNYLNYRELANAKGVSDYQVSKELGFPGVVFYEWKSGKSQPKLDKLFKIADYFGVQVNAIITQ